MKKDAKILVAGAKGLAGSAIVNQLKIQGYTNLLTPTRQEVDFLDQQQTKAYFAKNKPTHVFVAAAKVGGIMANKTQKADFIYQNLEVQNNIIHQSYINGVEKLLFLGSTCIYPVLAPQPLKEEYLLTGPLEETNDAYAIAKIAGIKMCEFYNKQYGVNFISAMPTNLYGINDSFDKELSHMVPALIRKIYEAKINNAPSITLWGSGTPIRDILFNQDFADAVIFMMQEYNSSEFLNIGSGEGYSIKEFAEQIAKLHNYQGQILWDTSRPDGTPKKYLDVSKINALGWKPKHTLEEGLKLTIDWFVENYDQISKRWP